METEKINPVQRLLISIVLWLVSVILKYLIAVVSWIIIPLYYIITIKWKTGVETLADWFYNIALSNDQHGNVVHKITLHVLFTKKGGEEFGNPDDTISYILARNKYQEKLKFGGRLMGGILDAIDYTNGGHLAKAINSKIEADQDAVIRANQNKYFE